MVWFVGVCHSDTNDIFDVSLLLLLLYFTVVVVVVAAAVVVVVVVVVIVDDRHVSHITCRTPCVVIPAVKQLNPLIAFFLLSNALYYVCR